MIWTFLLSNWRMVALAALVAANALTFGLWRHTANAFTQYRADIVALGKVQEAATNQAIAEQKQITKDVQDGYQQSIDYLRSHPVRVRSQPGPGSMPGLSQPASGTDETSDYPIPAAAELAAGCAETTNQLNFLQGWVEQQGNNK